MLTVVMPYYKNRGMLERHIEEWKKYPAQLLANMKFIIVDDGSPDGEDAYPVAFDAGMPNLELYKIKQDIPWNQDGARNLGMKHASGWVVLTDIDHLLTEEAARQIIRMDKSAGAYYVPGRRKANGEPKHRHPNSYIIEASTFWDAGGYNEDFRGYYGTDGAFKKIMNVVSHGTDVPEIQLVLFGREVIADASTRDLGRKNSEFYIKNNHEIYLLSKQTFKASNPLRFEWERLV